MAPFVRRSPTPLHCPPPRHLAPAASSTWACPPMATRGSCLTQQTTASAQPPPVLPSLARALVSAACSASSHTSPTLLCHCPTACRPLLLAACRCWLTTSIAAPCAVHLHRLLRPPGPPRCRARWLLFLARDQRLAQRGGSEGEAPSALLCLAAAPCVPGVLPAAAAYSLALARPPTPAHPCTRLPLLAEAH